MSKLLHTGTGRCPIEQTRTRFPQVWTTVWRRLFSLHMWGFFGDRMSRGAPLSEPAHAAMLAPFQESREES